MENPLDDYSVAYEAKLQLLYTIDDFKEKGVAVSPQIGMNSTLEELDQEVKRLKKELVVNKLNALKAGGVTLSKDYTVNDDYLEMSYELKYRTKQSTEKAMEQTVKMALPILASGVEILSGQYGLNCKGFADQVKERVQLGEYDSAIKVMAKKVSPEVDLTVLQNSEYSVFLQLYTDFMTTTAIAKATAINEEEDDEEEEDNDFKNNTDNDYSWLKKQAKDMSSFKSKKKEEDETDNDSLSEHEVDMKNF